MSVTLQTQTPPPPAVTGQAVTGVPLEQVSRHAVLLTDALATGLVVTLDSVRGMDGSPTVLAYQLPRVASSTPGPELPQKAHSRQGRSGPYGKHSDLYVYQPVVRFTLLPHVKTHPSPPPLESEAFEVTSWHLHPRSVQSGGQRAFLSGTSWGVETPSPGSPAELELLR